jgi:hypothetical protein
METPVNLQHVSMVALHQSEWSDLFSIGEVRISAGRIIATGENLNIDFNRIFAHSANRKLEDSAQMVVVTVTTGLNSLQKHPLSNKGDLVVIGENDVSQVQAVSQKDLFYIRETAEPFGFLIPDETLDTEWESWYVYEGIRRNTSWSIALCSKLGLDTNWKKRSDNLTWDQITTSLTRLNTTVPNGDLVLKIASNMKHLLSEVRTHQNTATLPIAISSAWIHLLTTDQPIETRPRLQAKIEATLADSRNRRIDGSEPFPDEILGLSKKMKGSYKQFFSREVTPLSLTFIFRFSYLNEISNISKDAFIVRLNQIRDLDGDHAARFAAFVIASRMGAEKVHELFFAKSAIEPTESLNLNPQTNPAPEPEFKPEAQDSSNSPTPIIQQIEN